MLVIPGRCLYAASRVCSLAPRRTRGGTSPVSSAILYVAIVAICACVLIPRWLHRSGGHTADPAVPEDVVRGDVVSDSGEDNDDRDILGEDIDDADVPAEDDPGS